MIDPDTPVGTLAEAEILSRIVARIGPSRAVVGPGDDAAVLADPGSPIVATTDTLVHGPDFRLAWSNGFDLGWKSAAVNLADVAAMGARPIALLVALAMPDDTTIGFVEQFAEGLRAACDALAPGCAVEGGDLTVSDTLTIAVTALGAAAAPVLRSGARPGDVVALAGDAGHAAHGLALLFGRFRDADGTPVPVDETMLTEDERTALRAQLAPRPPIGAGVEAARAGATSMIDVSDGLALDATRVADASGVTVALDPAALGADPAAALSGGEDHALLATFPPDAALPVPFRAIGWVRARGADALLVGDQPFAGRAGWDPYRDWDDARG